MLWHWSTHLKNCIKFTGIKFGLSYTLSYCWIFFNFHTQAAGRDQYCVVASTIQFFAKTMSTRVNSICSHLPIEASFQLRHYCSSPLYLIAMILYKHEIINCDSVSVWNDKFDLDSHKVKSCLPASSCDQKPLSHLTSLGWTERRGFHSSHEIRRHYGFHKWGPWDVFDGWLSIQALIANDGGCANFSLSILLLKVRTIQATLLLTWILLFFAANGYTTRSTVFIV